MPPPTNLTAIQNRAAQCTKQSQKLQKSTKLVKLYHKQKTANIKLQDAHQSSQSSKKQLKPQKNNN